MQMFQLGDEPGFDLKAPDEIGLIGVLGENDFDGHFTVNHRLVSAIDRAKGACANLLTQFIAANRLAAEIDRGLPPSQSYLGGGPPRTANVAMYVTSIARFLGLKKRHFRVQSSYPVPRIDAAPIL